MKNLKRFGELNEASDTLIQDLEDELTAKNLSMENEIINAIPEIMNGEKFDDIDRKRYAEHKETIIKSIINVMKAKINVDDAASKLKDFGKKTFLKKFGELDEHRFIQTAATHPDDTATTNKAIDDFLIKLVQERDKTNGPNDHTTAAELLIVYINTVMEDEERAEIKENI